MKAVSPSSLSRLHNNTNSDSNSNSNFSSNSSGRSSPSKRPLPVATTTLHNQHHHHPHINSIRLRSPKGSSPFTKRNHNALSWFERLLYRVLPPIKIPSSSSYFCYVILLAILFAVAYVTTQNIIRVSSNANNDMNHFMTSTSSQQRQIINPLSLFDATFHPVLPKSIYSPKSSNPMPVIYIGRSVQPLYPATSTRKKNNPHNGDNDKDDVMLDALQRSAYTKVVESYLYSSNNITHPMHLLYPMKYHPFNYNDHTTGNTKQPPLVFIVDWSALDRDCHLLQRIVAHIVQQNNPLDPKTNPSSNHYHRHQDRTTYMLLLDASASSHTIMCTDSSLLPQLIPNIHIRLAKRSIISHRRYNYTKQWIEAGSLIHNPLVTNDSNKKDASNDAQNDGDDVEKNHILHWSGYVSQSFVQLLDMVVNDFTQRSNKNRQWRRRQQRKQRNRYSKQSHNHHDRPIDVTHYWKSVTKSSIIAPNHEYQYYYNRLRQTVQQQINTTRIAIVKQQSSNHNNHQKDLSQRASQQSEETTLSRWVEFVGIDTQVEFVKGDSSSGDFNNDDGTSGKNKDDVEEQEEVDTVMAQSSVHVAVLASSRIVVVTQADEYEDHDTRLFEALASGAMVLCDTMMAPPYGLVHKTNIVFFDSVSKLDQYLQFYLDPQNEIQRQEIARHGLDYALGRHRSWHVLEALLFGKALTRTDKHPLMEEGPQKRKSTVKQTTRPVVISL
jgi:hypothetical protein